MITPEQSRQMAAYLASAEVAAMPVWQVLELRREMQRADSIDEISQPHRGRILAIKGLATKGGPPDLQEPPLRP